MSETPAPQNLEKEIKSFSGFDSVRLRATPIGGVFGADAKEARTSSGSEVSLVLKDGLLEGGQKVEVIIDRPSTVVLEEGFRVNAMKMSRLKVNGSDITDFFGDVYFAVRPLLFSGGQSGVQSYASLMRRAPGRAISLHLRRTFGSLASYSGKIVITDFTTADSLGTLLHEQGHLNDPNFHQEYSRNNRQLFSSLTSLAMHGDLDSGQAEDLNKSWKVVIMSEHEANRQALKLAKEISKRVSVFPGDEVNGFVRLKKEQELAVSTYLRALGWLWGLPNHYVNELMDAHYPKDW